MPVAPASRPESGGPAARGERRIETSVPAEFPTGGTLVGRGVPAGSAKPIGCSVEDPAQALPARRPDPPVPSSSVVGRVMELLGSTMGGAGSASRRLRSPHESSAPRHEPGWDVGQSAAARSHHQLGLHTRVPGRVDEPLSGEASSDLGRARRDAGWVLPTTHVTRRKGGDEPGNMLGAPTQCLGQATHALGWWELSARRRELSTREALPGSWVVRPRHLAERAKGRDVPTRVLG